MGGCVTLTYFPFLSPRVARLLRSMLRVPRGMLSPTTQWSLADTLNTRFLRLRLLLGLLFVTGHPLVLRQRVLPKAQNAVAR